MAARSKRPAGASTRAGRKKSKASTTSGKKAGVRKQVAKRKQGAATKKQSAAKKKQSAARKKRATTKKKNTKTKTTKGARKAKRPTGAAKSRAARASHPAAIARLYPERIGTVLHYYAQAQGAIVQLERGEVHLGDAVHIRGHTTDFYERIEELKIDDRAVEIARRGQTVGIRVSRTVREHDGVFLLSE